MIHRITVLFALCTTVGVALAEDAQVGFNRHVRAILADKCFACHGPDQTHRQAELRLDVRDVAVADRSEGPAIVPGNPAASQMMARILSEDADVHMPPAESGKQLSAGEIDILRRWIQQGAVYEGHWSFVPLMDVQPPAVTHTDFPRNAIDHFIAHALEQAGLDPSPVADKSTLLRRVYLDLIGLLPDRAVVEQFLHDERPEAYDELVDRLLKNPHYGERWGRHWLDQARYADSNGYTIDGERVMWPYRDWVIKSLNDDMPFDQFTIEQLAGDLLPHPTKQQLIATGFHRNTLINQEGGTDPEQFRVEAVMDRVATTGAVWLGLTVGCAQCHSHKFDPISQDEYYRFFAFFNHAADINDVGPTAEVHEGEIFLENANAAQLARLNSALAQAADLQAQRAQRQSAWEQSLLADASSRRAPGQLNWSPLKVTRVEAEEAKLTVLDDQSVLATPGVLREIYVVETEPLPRGSTIGSIQFRVLPHDSLPKRGPGLAGNGNFVLSALEVFLGDERLPVVSASSTHAQPAYPVSSLIDDDPGTGWAINVAPGSSRVMNAEHTAWLALGRSVSADGRPLKFVLKHELNNDYNVGRFQLSWSSDVVDSSTDVNLLEAVRTAAGQRSKDQKLAVDTAFAAVDEVYKQALGRVDASRRELGLGPLVRTMTMSELSSRRPTYKLTRGDFLRPDKDNGMVEPDVFDVLPELPPADPDRPLNRLDLARWLVHPDNPLTPRVTVNRIWMRYFGRGLVETENDFGAQGSPPTHPELLDWLARQFIANGWSQKSLHRLIVTSATYRQSSRHRADLAAVDPLNQLMGRQNRIRLDAELVRDAALSASGKLHTRIGGSSVHPPQPDGVYAFTQNRKNWQTDVGENRFRRTMYTMFYRSAPYPILTTFDAPDFQSVCTRRVRSNTPLQALTMGNDPALLELAQSFADRILADTQLAGQEDRQIERAFLIAYARRPSGNETELLRRFLAGRLADFSTDAAAAQQLIGDKGTDTPVAQRAAWTALTRALINTDEFVTRE
jgi:hypothetical protein